MFLKSGAIGTDALDKAVEEHERGKATGHLRHDVKEEILQGQYILQMHHKGHGRVKMAAGNGAAKENDGGQRNDNGQRLALAQDDAQKDKGA